MAAREPWLLVTGAAGFIGSRFVASCNARGVGVISVDDPRHFADRPEHRGIELGELVDYERLHEWLAASKRRSRESCTSARARARRSSTSRSCGG